jgi:DNA-binding transcriptional ArsR family regulator
MKRLSDEHTSRIAARARALSDVTRVRIIDLLARAELSVGRVAEALASQPSMISKHLQVLHREGLVDRRRDASTVIYSIADDGVVEWCHYLARPRLRAGAEKAS